MQLIIINMGLPKFGIRFSVVEAALLDGIFGVPTVQSNAGKAMGLGSAKIMIYVVMRQATRIIIPALGNSVNCL